MVANSLVFPQTLDFGILSGKVMDSVTNEGLPGVSVYFSNTTIGVSSDREGSYKIGKIPVGKYTIIVSMIGYEPIVQSLHIGEGTNIQKNFSLEYKVIEMKTITVQDQSDEYDAYFKELLNFRDSFKKYFLGQTEFSKDCKIENIEEILFDKKFEPNIKASCTKPIIIVNSALGYKLECVLLSFMFNNTREAVNCEFYPKFIELVPEDETQKIRWAINRKAAFTSSLRRFLLGQMKSNESLNTYSFTVPITTKLSKRIASSDMADGTEKIAHIDNASGLYFLKFKGFLFVNNLLTEEHSMVFLPYGSAYIGSDGYPIDPTSMQLSGVFAKHGVANLLPIDNSYLEWEEKNKE